MEILALCAGHRWIPLTKANDAELWCFLWSVPWINGWVNNQEAGDLRRHRAHYDIIVMNVQVIIDNRNVIFGVHQGWGAVSNLSEISDLSQKFKHNLWRVKSELKLSQKQHLTPVVSTDILAFQ